MGVAVQAQSYAMVTTNYQPETWHAFVVSFKFYFSSPPANTVFPLDLHFLHDLLDIGKHLCGKITALHEFNE